MDNVTVAHCAKGLHCVLGVCRSYSPHAIPIVLPHSSPHSNPSILYLSRALRLFKGGPKDLEPELQPLILSVDPTSALTLTFSKIPEVSACRVTHADYRPSTRAQRMPTAAPTTPAFHFPLRYSLLHLHSLRIKLAYDAPF